MENADGSFTIAVDALAPGAACLRGLTATINRKSYRVVVELKWYDESGMRSDRHIVELV